MTKPASRSCSLGIFHWSLHVTCMPIKGPHKNGKMCIDSCVSCLACTPFSPRQFEGRFGAGAWSRTSSSCFRQPVHGKLVWVRHRHFSDLNTRTDRVRGWGQDYHDQQEQRKVCDRQKKTNKQTKRTKGSVVCNLSNPKERRCSIDVMRNVVRNVQTNTITQWCKSWTNSELAQN